jgi:uncharacterized protein (DUF1501 family)
MGKWNRRDFLKTTCCSAAAGFAAASFSRFGLVNALAQNAADYKALVCVFLFGGNDSNNMVIPYDTTGYNGYKSARGGLALAQGSLLPITPSSIGSPLCTPSSFRGDAVAVQQQAPCRARERWNARTADDRATVPPRRCGGSDEPLLAFRPGSADADRDPG